MSSSALCIGGPRIRYAVINKAAQDPGQLSVKRPAGEVHSPWGHYYYYYYFYEYYYYYYYDYDYY